MASKKQSLKTGEKVLFAILGIFVVLAGIAYVVMESIRLSAETPMFENKTHYNFSALGAQGSQLFREARCTACHRALRNGTNMGLSLDGVGSARTAEWLYAFLKDPEKTYGAKTIDHGSGEKMEAAYVQRLPEPTLQAIATFLSELKADQGSASAPMPPEGRSEFIDDMVKTWAPKDWKEKYEDVREKQPQSGSVQ